MTRQLNKRFSSWLEVKPPLLKSRFTQPGRRRTNRTMSGGCRAPAHSEIRESIKVVSKDSVVQTAERKIALASNEDDDSDQDTGETESYWNFVAGIYGLLCTITVVIALGIYILWLFKKAVGHKFPLRFGGAALLLLLVTAGGSPPHDNSGNAVFAAIFIACFAAVGRAISTFARPKWMSLEQLCLLAPFAKPTGDSLAAGVLFSPLLVAVPVLVGSFVPHSAILPRNVETFYSRSPLLTSLDTQAFVSLLGVFGFALPALARVFRWRWLHLLIVLPLGTIFFTDEPRVITGPIAAPLIAGLATLLIFWFLYASFDLLAVLALQLSSGLVLTTCVLMQKGFSTGLLLPALAALLLAAYWLRVRGQPIPQGDPGATTPTITGFRAEREKLQAEFSLARRAQQDMLPDTPPSVPGYTIAASCTPSLEVGGDLYDFLKLPDGRIGIGVADVSGKGVPAALYMTLTKGLLSAVTKNNSELAQIVEEVNRHLHGVTRKKVFVTMVLGFLDAEKQVLECVRAGHNPVVWRQPGSDATTLVAPGGLGLGITAGRVFGSQLKIAEMALSEGDAVVFYSDGITEAMNSDLEQFGEQRLMDAVQKTDNMDAAASRDSILTTVKDFLAGVHPQDDMTLVVLRVGTK